MLLSLITRIQQYQSLQAVCLFLKPAEDKAEVRDLARPERTPFATSVLSLLNEYTQSTPSVRRHAKRYSARVPVPSDYF